MAENKALRERLHSPILTEVLEATVTELLNSSVEFFMGLVKRKKKNTRSKHNNKHVL